MSFQIGIQFYKKIVQLIFMISTGNSNLCPIQKLIFACNSLQPRFSRKKRQICIESLIKAENTNFTRGPYFSRLTKENLTYTQKMTHASISLHFLNGFHTSSVHYAPGPEDVSLQRPFQTCDKRPQTAGGGVLAAAVRRRRRTSAIQRRRRQ